MVAVLLLSLLVLSIALLSASAVLQWLPFWISMVLCGLALNLDLPYFIRGVAHFLYLAITGGSKTPNGPSKRERERERKRERKRMKEEKKEKKEEERKISFLSSFFPPRFDKTTEEHILVITGMQLSTTERRKEKEKKKRGRTIEKEGAVFFLHPFFPSLLTFLCS
jgi:hypothetical protein